MQLKKYLVLYAQSHQHPLNISLHNMGMAVLWTLCGGEKNIIRGRSGVFLDRAHLGI